jgi:hypothetical protein
MMIMYSCLSKINPRADGTKRRARVLIPPPPAIYTRGNESISEV